MNDELFEKWSESLSELRAKREEFLSRSIRQKGPTFEPKEYFDVALNSVEQSIISWWTFEQKWKEIETAPYTTEDVRNLRGEIDSTLDLEIDAINREIQSNKDHIAWNQDDVDEGFSRLTHLASDLKGSYEKKLLALLPEGSIEESQIEKPKSIEKKKKVDSDGTRNKPGSALFHGDSSSWSWTAFLGGAVLGLVFGGVGAIYFRDAAKKSQTELENKITALIGDKKNLEDNIQVFQQTFANLARGKTLTIPQLEEKIVPIRSEYEARRRRVDEEFNEKKKQLIRRDLEPDQHNKVLQRLVLIHEEQLKSISSSEKAELEPLLKQYQNLKDLLK